MPSASPEPRPGVIRSPDNRTIKFVRSLRRRPVRQAERAFVVEGMRAVGDALALGARPRLLLLRAGDPAAEQFLDASGPGAEVRLVAAELFDQLAETVTPQGVVGVFPVPDLHPDHDGPPLILVLDRLRDPGNLGTLLRTAAGAGCTLVALTPASVDPYNPKVVRAAMGAHFRVSIRGWDAALRAAVLATCPLRVIADANGGEDYDAVDWTRGAALFIGSEAHGISPEMRTLATARVRIPLAGGVESLNAAAAGAVLLFEAVRQRRGAVPTN